MASIGDVRIRVLGGGSKSLQSSGNLIKSICEHVNEAKYLTEYYLGEHEDDEHEDNWNRVVSELDDRIGSEHEMVKRDITANYGKSERNALMSILVCHPPLKVVKLLVEEGGHETVTRVGECGFNAMHYACWGNASLEVIDYLLEIGKKTALLKKSVVGGANPLHVVCNRYKSNESSSLSDVIRLLIKVGGLDVVTATDHNNEIPFHGLLLHNELDVDGSVTYLDEWYKLKEKGKSIASITEWKKPQRTSNEAVQNLHNEDGDMENNPLIDRSMSSHESYGSVEQAKDNESKDAFYEALDKIIRQLINTPDDARGKIMKSQFMKEYLTERFIEPLPLAILIMDLYIQVMIVCVYSFFINPNAPDLFDSTTIKYILIICIAWRVFRELTQLMTSTFRNYWSDIDNWFDFAQIALIVLTLRTNLAVYSSSSSHWVLIFATIFSWFELLLEIHNFNYNLALFVVSIFKIMKRLLTFVFTVLIFIATFAHAYYIIGPEDKEVCNNEATYSTKEEFNSAGGFTCTRTDSYRYSFSNLFDFAIPSGFFWIQVLYFFVMSMLLLNIIIAVICEVFGDVQKESELTFWSDRLEIVNELGGLCSGTHGRVRGCCDNLSVSKRIDLNLFLERSVWDGIFEMEEEEKSCLHWWYGKEKGNKPPFGKRLRFFFKKSVVKDIFIPASVFENVLLGKTRSEKVNMSEKMLVFPLSIILMVSSNALFAIVVISGWLSFGVLWPKIVKEQLFSIQKMKTKTDEEIEISEMRKEISEMKNENIEMKNVNIEMKNVNIEMKNENIEMGAKIQEILSGIKHLTEMSKK